MTEQDKANAADETIRATEARKFVNIQRDRREKCEAEILDALRRLEDDTGLQVLDVHLKFTEYMARSPQVARVYINQLLPRND